MQYTKHEVPLEKKDVSMLNTFTGFTKILQIAVVFILGIGALIALFVVPSLLGWTIALIIVAVIIGVVFLAFYFINLSFIKPIKIEINNGVKFEHRGVLTNKRDEMVYGRENGKHRIIQTFFITLNETEIRIGDIDNLNTLKLYESLQLNKNYKVSQSVRDAYVIFGVEEIH